MTVVFITSGTTWTVPSDWNSVSNSIEGIGGGGAGGGAGQSVDGNGGGGGAYAIASNVALTPGAVIPIQIGQGGTGVVNANGGAGTDTIFNTTTPVVVAKGGAGGLASGNAAVPGGAASSCTPTTGAASGGQGNSFPANAGFGGGGGGGAGGPHGIGAAGAANNPSGTRAGNGGGASDGGTAGTADGGSGTGNTGGAGGTAHDATAGGAGGTAGNPGNPGSHGSGGGGAGGDGVSTSNSGGLGGAGVGWVQSSNSAVAGPGGGAGGSGGSSVANGVAGGLYGGGGGAAGNTGGGKGGNGANGILVVTYSSGETLTANYSWTKPVVGASPDVWGGYINADLDGIDSTVKSVSNAVPLASSTTPAMDGTATVGTGTTFARADHIHPTDTSRYAASNPSGYQTAAQVTAVVPVASSTTPLMNGIAAVGTGTTWARADHVHPSDVAAMNDNRIINGDMRIDQRNAGASGTAAPSYTVDRWKYTASVGPKGTWQRVVATGLSFPYCLQFTSSSAYASVASDIFMFSQPIEADSISDFMWGTVNAQPVTLSFWVTSSLNGTFSGSILNIAGTRGYPFTFSIPVANTWTRIVLTIPGDTAGTWVMSGNNGSAAVAFDLGCGSANRGSAGSWQNGQLFGATGAVSVVGTNAATFYVTGVKLEIGSVATPYNRQSLAKSLADCQRYFQKIGGAVVQDLLVQGYVSASGQAVAVILSFPSMRSAPTVAQVGAFTTGTVSSVNIIPGLQTMAIQLNGSATGNAVWYNPNTSTYLTASAEL